MEIEQFYKWKNTPSRKEEKDNHTTRQTYDHWKLRFQKLTEFQLSTMNLELLHSRNPDSSSELDSELPKFHFLKSETWILTKLDKIFISEDSESRKLDHINARYLQLWHFETRQKLILHKWQPLSFISISDENPISPPIETGYEISNPHNTLDFKLPILSPFLPLLTWFILFSLFPY